MKPLMLHSETDTGDSVYGTTEYYAFLETLDQSASYIEIHVSGSDNHTVHVQNRVFVVPSMTQINGSLLEVTVACQDSALSIHVDVAAPTGQHGSLGPRIDRRGIGATRATHVAVPGYDLWQASLDLGVQVTGAVAINAVAGGRVEDVLYLNSGVAGW